MIDRNTVVRVLQQCSANANDKTPNPSEATIQAWLDYYAQYPYLTAADVFEATRQYCSAPRERLVQPQDIGVLARQIHQDVGQRRPTDHATEQVELEPVDQSEFERDGSNYGRFEPVTENISIEVKFLPDGAEQFRFFWDGPLYQPYVGEWFDVKTMAIEDGIRWCREHQAGPDVTTIRAAVEHAPGAPCEEPGCPKPSTFGQWCAKHYCLRKMHTIGIKV